MARIRLLIMAVLTLAALLPAAPATAVTELGDTLGIVKEGVAPSNVEIAVRLSEATSFLDADAVVIARDDQFADALASGVLQHDAPMLLVPSTGPLPERVTAEIQRLGPDRAIVLGGSAAVSEEVAGELAAQGLAVDRRTGRTRFETAAAIAADAAPEATTAILARAFPSPGATDDTQAFADTLGVAAWAAEDELPILLSNTAELPEATRAYIAGSRLDTIQIVGGTAAISEAVAQELRDMGLTVNRVAGVDRFETAIAVAGMRGIDDASDVSQVVVVDSQFGNAWAGGLAAAGFAAQTGAPIVLTSGANVPAATEAFLSSGTDGGSATPIACVAFPAACETARVTIGLPAAAAVAPDTPDGAVVGPGQPVTVAIDSGGRPVSDVVASGSCLDGPVQLGSSTTVTVTLADPLPAVSCELRIDFVIATGRAGFSGTGSLAQAEVLTYTVAPTTDGLAVIGSGAVLDARQLASNLVGEDVQVFDARLTGAPDGAGLFAGGNGVFGFDQGIVLSTGRVADVVGPNISSSTSGFFSTPGDDMLSALAGQPTFDAVILEFDFVGAPSAGTVAFDYVFSSEEYTEFVGSDFNDVFAFTINGQNCAMVEGGPVSVNTVNNLTNAGFFRPNEAGELDMEMDGLTVTLPCAASINPGGANHVRLAVADASDDGYDTAVFIRAASFTVG